ncbi:Bromodomain-containing protein 8 [Eumeta japonica]|uniref:Bromodomain-containing protein 8 n=1 Tax=Eumeta variegata TaxID=151549 RepID=A0A4C1ZGT1_EUMVA|nr:Bromodomain-containing protein 8 [Eumeta japonica]
MAGRKGDLVLGAPAQSLLHCFPDGEMVALQRAIRRVKNGKDGLVNIFSDSRSSLEVLTGSKTYHPLAHEARRDISGIVAEGGAVRLFWVRARAGIVGSERADELARWAALTKKTAADYDRFPLSYAKKVIRAANLEEWQQRYVERSTDSLGFSQYLFRFKLRDSPYCICDPAKSQDVLHVLGDFDKFLRERAALEAGIGVRISKWHFPEFLEDSPERLRFPSSRQNGRGVSFNVAAKSAEVSFKCIVNCGSFLVLNYNCAAQYGALLEHVETPKRKKRSSEGAVETPQESILKRLTQERIIEIQKNVSELTQHYQVLKMEVSEIRDPATSEERLRELWAEIENAKRLREREQARRIAWLREREERRARAQRPWRAEASSAPTTPTTAVPPSSPLLTSLLQSSPVVTTPQHISHPANIVDTLSPSAGAPTLSMLLEKGSAPSVVATTSAAGAANEHAAIEHIKSQLVQIERQYNATASACASPSTVPIVSTPVVPEATQLVPTAQTTDKIDIDDIEINAEDVYAFSDIDFVIAPVSSMHKNLPKSQDKPIVKKEDEPSLETPVGILPEQPAIMNMIEESESETSNAATETPPANERAPEIKISFPEVKFPTPEIKVIQPEDQKIKEESTREVETSRTRPEPQKESAQDKPLPSPVLIDHPPSTSDTVEPVSQGQAQAEDVIQLKEEDVSHIPLPPDPPQVESGPERRDAEASVSDEPVSEVTAKDPVVTEENNGGEEVVSPEKISGATQEETVEKKDTAEDDGAHVKKEIVEDQPAPSLPTIDTREQTGNESQDCTADGVVKDTPKDEVEAEAAPAAVVTATAAGPGAGDAEASAIKEEKETEDVHTETDDDTPMELIREEEKDGKKKRDYSRKKKPDSRTCSGSESAAEASAPESPAAGAHPPSDAEREHRLWKKSVMLVYNRLCAHKYASLFLRPITDEQAPGYSAAVRRPMDLGTIKRNIDSGVIRTTAEFQRDVLLMLSNALMYNSSDHRVYHMAVEMHQEVGGAFDVSRREPARKVLVPRNLRTCRDRWENLEMRKCYSMPSDGVFSSALS